MNLLKPKKLKMSKTIYLDYNATTPISEEVLQEMNENIGKFANPASSHIEGQIASNLLENSREVISDFLHANPQEIIFTSSATESNNTVLSQVLKNPRIKKLLISAVEHPSISEYADYLNENGVEVVIIPVDNLGFIDLDFIEKNINNETLVSIIWANNEIGTIQNAEKIAEIVKQKSALLHFDAVQAFGKIKISAKEIPFDFLSFSSHKIYGPRGIGGLFVREGIDFFPLIIGGGQENGFRAGTANQWLACGFAKAVELRKNMRIEQENLWNMREKLKEKLKTIDGISFNGSQNFAETLAGTLSITISDIENEIIALRLDNAGICVSKGSACASQKVRASSVLTAIGLSNSAAARTIRVSFGKQTTEDDIDFFADKLSEIVQNIRKSRNGS